MPGDGAGGRPSTWRAFAARHFCASPFSRKTAAWQGAANEQTARRRSPLAAGICSPIPSSTGSKINRVVYLLFAACVCKSAPNTSSAARTNATTMLWRCGVSRCARTFAAYIMPRITAICVMTVL